MRPPHLTPSIVRLRPTYDAGTGEQPVAKLPPGKKGWPHAEGTVSIVRKLVEETTLTYAQITARTGVSAGSISRWMNMGGWKRPLFAPRSMLTRPTPRATAYNQHRLLSRRLFALADRYTRELEDAEGVDLDKLGEALELAKMAKLAMMTRTRRRVDATTWGEPLSPISELCAAGVILQVAPKEALKDFLANREKPRPEDMPPRSRGMSTPQHLRRARQHALMKERE
jgi:hypothetical protein